MIPVSEPRSRPLAQAYLVPIVVVVFSIAVLATVVALVLSSPRVTALMKQLEPPRAEAR